VSDDHKIGISRAELDAIELRLIGCDHRPWHHDPEWRIIAKGSKKATRKAYIGAMRQPDGRPYVGPKFADGPEAGEKEHEHVLSRRDLLEALTLFKQHDNSTNDMAAFVANAPDDVEALLNAVKFLQTSLEKARADRDEFKKEMLSLRIDNAAIQQKLTEMRSGWRNLKKLME
jgi:hypothetical protein